jgi:hypothetical protein
MRKNLDQLVVRPLVPVLVAVSLAGGCEREPRDAASQAQALEALPQAQSGPEVEFSRIGDVDVDSRGQIYAGDGLGEIVVMSETGSLVRRFGGMGFGPGEFEAVSAVHVLPSDSLYIYDGVALRATVYLPHSNRVAYTVRFPQTDFSFPVDIEPNREGFLLGHFRRINGDVPIAGQRRDDVVRILNRDGSIRLDSAVVLPEPEIVEVRNARNHGFFFPRFARQSLVRWGVDGRIYSLWTDSTRISIHGADGRSHGGFTAQLPFPRLPIAAATIDTLSEQSAGAEFTRRSLEEAFRGRWQTWPLVQDMLVDDQSRIWLQPFTQAPEASWLAFDTKGRQLATLRLPRSVRPRLIRGDRMYAVSTDSLDVETLVVYRLTPSSTRTTEEP